MIGSNGVLCCQYALMVSAQSLTIMRLHVTIYSTNVDDDDMWESGSPRSGSGEAGVLAATIGSSPMRVSAHRN